MKVVDLFCGEGATAEATGWSCAFRDRGHEVFTVDYEAWYEPDLVADVREVTADDFPWQPDIILASPPCQAFSVMRISMHWNHDGTPRTEKAKLGLDLVRHTRRIIREAKPKFFVIENPRGMMGKLGDVQDLERRFITYCQYGRWEQKPTHLWGGFPPSLVLKPPCGPGMTCHDAAPRGSWREGGVQGVHNRLKVTAIPYQLSWQVCLAAEEDLGEDSRRMDIRQC